MGPERIALTKETVTTPGGIEIYGHQGIMSPAPELEKNKEFLTTLDVLRKRKEEGYVRGSRKDGNFVAVMLGPGGWAGEVSIGEYLELERAGLTGGIDLIAGSSVGGLIGTYMASGQCREGLDVFLEFMPKHGRIPKMESLMDAVFKEYPIQFDRLPKDLPIVIALTDLDKFGTRLVRSDQVDPVEFEELTIRACHQALVGGKAPVLTGEVMTGTRVSDSALSLPNTAKLAELISDQYEDLRITHVLSLENIRQAKNTPMNRIAAEALNRPIDAWIKYYDPTASPEKVFTASLSGGQFSDIRAYKREFEGPLIDDTFTTKSEKGHEIVVERVYPADIGNLPGLFMLNLKEKGIRRLRRGYDAGRIAVLERLNPRLELKKPQVIKTEDLPSVKKEHETQNLEFLSYFKSKFEASKPGDISWAHGVNDEKTLGRQLEDNETMVLECDVVVMDKGGEPMLFHAGQTEPPIPLRQFSEAVKDSDKAVMLDIKTPETILPALQFLREAGLKQPVFLNADVLTGNDPGWPSHIDAKEFIQLCEEKYPQGILSLSWTTFAQGEEKKVSKQNVDQMLEAIKDLDYVVIPVKASFAKESVEQIKRLMKKPGVMLRFWNDESEPADPGFMDWARQEFGEDRILLALVDSDGQPVQKTAMSEAA